MILPALFSNTYKKKELKGSVVFMENCQGFGANGNRNDALAKALKKSGAEFIMGFHNSVNGEYSREMLRTFVMSMMNGTTTEDAFAQCVDRCGISDLEWLRKTNPNYQKKNGEGAAPPFCYGNLKYTLWKGGITKGSFEKQTDETEDATLQGWKKEGDVRTITRLGELAPVDGKYMAIITTGIGSAEDEYLNGESRSSLLQRFKIPEGTTTLAFSYNVVSEEPMEYVGSRYDDTFSAKIYDSDGISFTEVARESVNTSSWQAVSGIDFDGGDSTVYQTGWKTIEIDVISYGGQDVILSFDVCDKGDSAYDTAVLIDNVRLQGGN